MIKTPKLRLKMVVKKFVSYQFCGFKRVLRSRGHGHNFCAAFVRSSTNKYSASSHLTLVLVDWRTTPDVKSFYVNFQLLFKFQTNVVNLVSVVNRVVQSGMGPCALL